uniref:Permease n=1 Tax=Solibacter usitatus (strain Ellin6076) TaxID=234267 RepID=Q01NG5_SOLUE
MSFFRRRKFERDMETELAFHIDAYIEDLVRSGLDPREAARRARLEFGAMDAAKDDCRRVSGFHWIDELRADLRYTLRTFRRNPGYASIAILSLALGIGANTAIFGLVDAVLLRILPVRDPGRLVFVQNVGTQGQNGGPPYPCFELLRDRARSFETVAAFSPSNMEVVLDHGREQVRGVWVSGNFYSLLGVKPLLGRALSPSDDETVGRGGPDGPVAVISRAYWLQRFGGDPGVIGRNLGDTTIVGVMPSEVMSLEPGRPIDIAVPMALSDPVMLRERGSWWLDVVARLKPGVRPEQARAESDALFQAYMSDISMSPATRKLAFDHIELAPAGAGMDRLRLRFLKPLAALLILAGLVLLAACVTVANLMLARATARQKEFAVRLAIGAGRGRLMRQTLTESLVLVGAACLLGIVLARQGQTALAAFFAEGNSQIILDLVLNGRILLFTLAVSLLTGLTFGLLPALRAAAVDPATGLQAGARGIAGSRAGLRITRALVVLQVALSMVLLACAGVFVHSLQRLQSVDAGFTREGILTMEVAPEKTWFGKPEWLALQNDVLDRIRRMPGVRSAAWSTMTPLSGRDRGVVMQLPGRQARPEIDNIHMVSVSPEYFATLESPLLQGRAFTASDGPGAPHVAILNQAAARFYFGDTSPIGRQVVFPFRASKAAADYEIVGVVKDAKHASLRAEPWRFVYLPIPQAIDRINRVALSVRCIGDPVQLAAPIQKELHNARATLLITNVSTIEKQVELSLMRERLVSTLSITFGAVALLLSCIGLYGILAYTVTSRTTEIGIRLALGATRAGMVWLILREAVVLAISGIVIGIPASWAVGKFSRALLFGVEPFDLLPIATAILVLLVFAALAGFIPARRAGRLDPMSALRSE